MKWLLEISEVDSQNVLIQVLRVLWTALKLWTPPDVPPGSDQCPRVKVLTRHENQISLAFTTILSKKKVLKALIDLAEKKIGKNFS